MTKIVSAIILGLLGASTALASKRVPGKPPWVLNNLQHDRDMEAFVRGVFETMGLPNKVPVVIDPDASQACAYAVISGGKPFIAVYPPCVGPLRSNGNYNWRAVAILAHEMGHLLAGDSVDPDYSPSDEAEADEFSGWLLFHLGASLDETETLFRTFSEKGSDTHPPRAVRLAAADRGWNRARLDVGVVPKIILTSAPPPTLVSTPAPTPVPPPPPPPPASPVMKRQPPKVERSWWEDLMTKQFPWAR